jgi:hypothetical protein
MRPPRGLVGRSSGTLLQIARARGAEREIRPPNDAGSEITTVPPKLAIDGLPDSRNPPMQLFRHVE